MIQLIILDFDGVILESISLKTEAFRQIFSFTPEHIDEIIQYHKDHGGTSRYDKLQYIYSNILHENLNPQKFEELSNTFSTIVFNKVIKAPFVPGGHEFLESYHSIIPLYVVSATPIKELIQIIQNRGMTHYFRGIYGAPQKKLVSIKKILNLTTFPPDSVIFVGDAKSDLEAAREAKVRFVGRIKTGEDNHFNE